MSLRRLSLALGSLVLLLAASLRALAAPIDVPVDRFRPTQLTIGKASARLTLEAWKRDAALHKMSLADYAMNVLQPSLYQGAVPAVIDHTGALRNTDAHHRIAALQWLGEETGVHVTVKADVVADYSGKSEKVFADEFVGRLKKGWFGARLAKASPLQKVRALPTSFSKLGDDPLRSSVDTAFEILGLQGRMFREYVEFRVADALVGAGLFIRLEDKGLVGKGKRTLDADKVFDEKIVAEISTMLREPRLKKLLLENAKSPETASQVRAALAKRPDSF